MKNVRFRSVVTVVATGLVSVFALSGTSTAATAGPDQGVTDNSVKIGFIYSHTGVASATTADAHIGCKARVARENANGGVNGRKIQVEYFDDQSSGANLTGAQNLVQNEHVYLIVNDSAFAFLSYRWLLDHGVPLIGGGADGTYYGDPGNEDIISGLGNQAPVAGVTTDLVAKIMKAQGAKRTAALGYGIAPPSWNAAKSFNQYAAPAAGLLPVYTNITVDFGTTDVGSYVLGIKNSGADGAYYTMNGNTNLAFVQGLKQNGVDMKAQVMEDGYGQALLDQPIATQLGPSVIFLPVWQPVELKTKATKQFQADLEKYAGYTDEPDFWVYSGYTSCDLAITGLKEQGDNLDPSTYADGLRKLGHVNPANLGCQPLDISSETYGQPSATDCAYAVTVKDGKFRAARAEGHGQGVLDRQAHRAIRHREHDHHHRSSRLTATTDPQAARPDHGRAEARRRGWVSDRTRDAALGSANVVLVATALTLTPDAGPCDLPPVLRAWFSGMVMPRVEEMSLCRRGIQPSSGEGCWSCWPRVAASPKSRMISGSGPRRSTTGGANMRSTPGNDRV